MNKLLFIAAMFIACSCSCDMSLDTTTMNEYVVEMEKIIASKEATLDSIENVFPFMDTIGETDEYLELCETREAFELSNNYTSKSRHFTDYCNIYDSVISNTMRLIAEDEDCARYDTMRHVRLVFYNDNY